MENLQLKRYTIKEKTGEGGMADVYLAYDNVLNRECAIKIMKLQLAHDPVARIRFRREADAAATLQHPNIVTIYDVGESNNRPFIVMEFIRGLTLKDLIAQRGAIEKREAVQIATQMVEGLKVAHDAGVIHRDVKPHNILIKSDGTAKITDFGIASIQGAIQLTQHDSVMGSVHYLAPECSRGEAASVQSDLYSVGIVLYEMLIGDVPFKGDSAVQVAMKHLQEEVPSIRSINNSIEQSIENIIIKATSKNKSYRYQNADEMLADLKVCLNPEHANDAKLVLAPLNQEAQQTRVFSDLAKSETVNDEKVSLRNKILYAVIGLSVLALLGILLSFFFNSKPKEPVKFELMDLSKMTVEEAQQVLEEVELKLNPKFIYETSDEIEKDKIIKTNPVAKTKVAKGDTITLIISSGEAFVVEDYTNKDLDDVLAQLKKLEYLKVNVDYKDTNEVKGNTIISQEGLEINQKLDPTKEYELTLVVARPTAFQIPDLRGQDINSAKAELEKLGARVILNGKDSTTLSDEEWENTEFEVVISMSPDQNSSFTPSETNAITLNYYNPSEREIVKVNTSLLSNRINEARAMDTSNMSEESVYTLSLAIKNADNVLANPESTQNQVDEALRTLNEAINLLKPRPVKPHNPVVNPVSEKETMISGTADPNISILITNSDYVQIGIGMSNADGTFNIEIAPQKAGTDLIVVASNNEGLTSDQIVVTVTK